MKGITINYTFNIDGFFGKTQFGQIDGTLTQLVIQSNIFIFDHTMQDHIFQTGNIKGIGFSPNWIQIIFFRGRFGFTKVLSNTQLSCSK
jgi:hypothetical protein